MYDDVIRAGIVIDFGLCQEYFVGVEGFQGFCFVVEQAVVYGYQVWVFGSPDPDGFVFDVLEQFVEIAGVDVPIERSGQFSEIVVAREIDALGRSVGLVDAQQVVAGVHVVCAGNPADVVILEHQFADLHEGKGLWIFQPFRFVQNGVDGGNGPNGQFEQFFGEFFR